MTPDFSPIAADQPVQFLTTQWNVVLSSSGQTTIADQALGELCRVYWRPTFAFICRRGYSVSDAQDLTQEFFVRLLNRNLIAAAHPSRGRFRSLLLRALQNFLVDESLKGARQKRGGQMRFVSWDDLVAEAPSQLALPGDAMEAWSAERLFDARWAATVVEQALGALREECEARGRGRVFEVLRGSLSENGDRVAYSQLASDLGVTEAFTRRLLQALRERYRTLLRREVARTVETEEDLNDEIRYLCAMLAATE